MINMKKERLLGKLEGIELALNIINRREVASASVRWLVREADVMRTKIKMHESMEEEE